ncbi:uncharacterized protein LOC130966140 [Arachis stenosperma]|uniref:uncharacterized protein LOC130966140 n=1 Tax=Arachis stenosperma TaxID=217475 RepID=UPI0025AD8D1E|nr:uncharacterized protein LOC130966140 [Arachis stenosperma]
MVSEDLGSDLLMEDPAPFNPKSTIEVSLEEYEDWCKPCKLSLIVKPLDNVLNLQALDRWVQRRWVKKGSIRVMDLEGKFFLVRFTDQDDYSHALFEGPWMIADHYLLVQRWRPLFISQEMDVQKVAVWIRIPNLPAELYNKYFLWKVGKALGTMLKVDDLTSIHSRGRFARICVEIDLRKKIIPTFTALGKDFNIVYEGLHQICFSCGRYDHRMENCHDKVAGTTSIGRPKAAEGSKTSHEEPSSNGQESNQGVRDLQQDPKRKDIPIAINQKTITLTSQEAQLNEKDLLNHTTNLEEISVNQGNNLYGQWMIVKKNQRKT